MKKLIVLVVALVCVTSLISCSASEQAKTGKGQTRTPVENTPDDETLNQWGITLEVDNVTANGLTIICNQFDGKPSGELETGCDYVVEECIDGSWYTVDYIIDAYNVAWTAEAWIIPLNDSVEWEVKWEWLYGELPAGKYRIGKDIMDYRAPGDYNIARGYVEFVI